MTSQLIVCVCVCVVSDDMLIKLWDWEKKWSCSQVFEGHTHYVMQIVINPKDNNQFASASLDRTIKVISYQRTAAGIVETANGHEDITSCPLFFFLFFFFLLE